PAVYGNALQQHALGVRDECGANVAGAWTAAAICQRAARRGNLPGLTQSRRHAAHQLSSSAVPAIPSRPDCWLEGGLWPQLDVAMSGSLRAARGHNQDQPSNRMDTLWDRTSS